MPTSDVPEAQQLRRVVGELVALSALPAAGAGGDPSQMAAGIADALVSGLRPGLVYVCLRDGSLGGEQTMMRLDGRPGSTQETQQVEAWLASELSGAPVARDVTLPDPAGGAAWQVAIAPLGPGGTDGLLAVGARQTDFPNEVERLLLSGCANQAVIWGRQARLDAERRRQAERLARLNQLGQTFAAELNFQRLVQAVTDAATELVGAEFGAFFQNAANQSGEHLTLHTLSGAPREAFEHFPTPRATPVFAPTFHGTGIVRSANIQEDPRFGQLPPYHGLPPGHLPVKSYLAVPVISRSGGVLGGLFFGHAQPDRFGPQDEALLVGLAAQAAIALDNARLYQAEQQARERLETHVEARTAELLHSEARFHSLVDSVQDYAIFMLDPDGQVASWNTGAERIKGYQAAEVTGRHFSLFYTPEDAAVGKPQAGLARALQDGHFEAEGWRVRKDGSRFWANVVITPVRDAHGALTGYAKVTRDLTARKQMEDALHRSREQLRQLSVHLEQTREDERSRMAREIHDELGGMLTGLKMDVAQLRRLGQALGAPGLARLNSFSEAIDQAIQTVRRIATDLRPAVLDDFGLLAAMEWQLGEFEARSTLQTTWTSNAGEVDLTGDSAAAVFRVFQESLTNIARHAQATAVAVTVNVSAEVLTFEVADNGRGITPQEARSTTSLGLAGMRERLALLGGQLEIEGRAGQGTTLVVTVPLPAAST